MAKSSPAYQVVQALECLAPNMGETLLRIHRILVELQDRVNAVETIVQEHSARK